MKRVFSSILILAIIISTCIGISATGSTKTVFKTINISSNYSVKIPNEFKKVNIYSDDKKIDKNIIYYSNNDKIDPYFIDAETSTYELAFYTSASLKTKPKNLNDFITAVNKTEFRTDNNNEPTSSAVISCNQVKGGKVTVKTYGDLYSSGEGDGLIPREVMFFQTLKGDYIAVSFLCYGDDYGLSDKSSVIKNILSSIKYIPTKTK